MPKGGRAGTVSATIKECSLWPLFKVLTLSTNMRVERLGRETEKGQRVAQFAQWLLDIGNGLFKKVLVPSHMWVDYAEPLELIRRVFPELGISESAAEGSCILTTLNKHVDELNDVCLGLDQGLSAEYLSADFFGPECADIEEHYPVEILNQLSPSGLPPHRLTLKKGAPVVFLRNMNRKLGVMNGTRGVIEAYQETKGKKRIQSFQ